MNDITFYLKEGLGHIFSIDAIDHILFLIALTAPYLLREWKKVLILTTAFTIGHSLTLALSIYNILHINTSLVEFFIPCTIIITALFNFFKKDTIQKSMYTNYLFVLFFGFIHGLGYANTIRFMLAKDQSFGYCLLGFNIGLEIAQIAVVTAILVSNYLAVNICGFKHKYWIYVLSVLTFTWAVKFALERIP
jgi:HupE / UreJ protein